MLLACLAQDCEGAKGLALALARAGLRTVQTVGVPAQPLPDTDALVMSLGLRGVPAADAVERALTAMGWLRLRVFRQLFLQHGNPIEETGEGNVGQVIDALLAALGSDFTIACPAAPAEGVMIRRGHLLMGDRLPRASGQVGHALRPTEASDLVGVMAQQTRRKVGLVRFDTVARGPAALSARFAALRAESAGIAIVDALGEGDLASIGAACAGLSLVTGGDAMAAALAGNFRAQARVRAAARPLLRIDALAPRAETGPGWGMAERRCRSRFAIARPLVEGSDKDGRALAGEHRVDEAGRSA